MKITKEITIKTTITILKDGLSCGWRCRHRIYSKCTIYNKRLNRKSSKGFNSDFQRCAKCIEEFGTEAQ